MNKLTAPRQAAIIQALVEGSSISHAVALHFAHYNFCRVHATLTKAAKGTYRTPAMAAGLTDHVWTVADLVALLDQKAIA